MYHCTIVPLKSVVFIPSLNADAAVDAWCEWTLKNEEFDKNKFTLLKLNSKST